MGVLHHMRLEGAGLEVFDDEEAAATATNEESRKGKGKGRATAEEDEPLESAANPRKRQNRMDPWGGASLHLARFTFLWTITMQGRSNEGVLAGPLRLGLRFETRY